MKGNAISTLLFLTLLSQPQISYAAGGRSGTPLNLPNDISLGTDGVHITWNCLNDAMGCQNMCYYFYCLGRTNMWTKVPDDDKYKTTKANRGGSGQIFNGFYPENRDIYNTEVYSDGSNVSDECPPASSLQGGEGAALIGHETWRRQGGRMTQCWRKAARAGSNRVWIEMYNWDPAQSPACNCKPNWPEHQYFNEHGKQCQCDEGRINGLIYRLNTERKDPDQGEFTKWPPHPNWADMDWNNNGYEKNFNPKKKVQGEGGNFNAIDC